MRAKKLSKGMPVIVKTLKCRRELVLPSLSNPLNGITYVASIKILVACPFAVPNESCRIETSVQVLRVGRTSFSKTKGQIELCCNFNTQHIE